MIKRLAHEADGSETATLASVSIPTETALTKNSRLVAAFCGILDEGELGTMVRTATALGFDHIVFLEKCADIFSLKVTKASQGSLWKTSFSLGCTSKLLSFASTNRYLPIQPGNIETPSMNIDAATRHAGLIALICPHHKKGFNQISTSFHECPWIISRSCFLHNLLLAK